MPVVIQYQYPVAKFIQYQYSPGTKIHPLPVFIQYNYSLFHIYPLPKFFYSFVINIQRGQYLQFTNMHAFIISHLSITKIPLLFINHQHITINVPKLSYCFTTILISPIFITFHYPAIGNIQVAPCWYSTVPCQIYIMQGQNMACCPSSSDPPNKINFLKENLQK